MSDELKRYKKNLKIEGDKVLSYGTHVATIDRENKRLLQSKSWSQTTTKHINYVAEELGLELVRS